MWANSQEHFWLFKFFEVNTMVKEHKTTPAWIYLINGTFIFASKSHVESTGTVSPIKKKSIGTLATRLFRKTISILHSLSQQVSSFILTSTILLFNLCKTEVKMTCFNLHFWILRWNILVFYFLDKWYSNQFFYEAVVFSGIFIYHVLTFYFY